MSGERRRKEEKQLGLAARGGAPAGRGEGQNGKGRTLRQFPKDKDSRHSPLSLFVCPHSNRAGKYQSQSTNINPSNTTHRRHSHCYPQINPIARERFDLE